MKLLSFSAAFVAVATNLSTTSAFNVPRVAPSVVRLVVETVILEMCRLHYDCKM